MAFNGSGVFSRLYNWATEQLSSPIEISKLDLQEEDIATALSNCVLRDGTGKPVAAIDFNSQRLTALGDATGATDALNRQTADARYQQVVSKYKPTATNRSSTTTLTDDPDLVGVSIASGGVYIINCMLMFDASVAAMGIKSNLYFSGSGSAHHGTFRGVGGSTSSGAFTIQLVSGTVSITDTTVGSTAFGTVQFINAVLIASSVGNLSVQWSQNSSNGSALALEQGSYLQVMRVA